MLFSDVAVCCSCSPPSPPPLLLLTPKTRQHYSKDVSKFIVSLCKLPSRLEITYSQDKTVAVFSEVLLNIANCSLRVPKKLFISHSKRSSYGYWKVFVGHFLRICWSGGEAEHMHSVYKIFFHILVAFFRCIFIKKILVVYYFYIYQ